MNIKSLLSTGALCLAGLLQPALASTLTFEDLDPSPASYDAMTVYKGFTFTNWLYGPDTVYSTASGVIDLFTDFADPNDPFAWVITKNNAITSATAFYFDGAWVSGSSGVTFELYLDDIPVGTSATLPDASGNTPYGPTFLASGYAGLVNKIVVSGVQGFYALDDFTYHEAAVEIPEPSTYLLVLLGMVGTAARTRR